MAFSPRKMDSLKGTIRTLFGRAIQYHASPELTTDDIYMMLVKDSDIEKLRQIEADVRKLEIYGLERTFSSVNTVVPYGHYKVDLQVALSNPIKGLLPAYVSKGFKKNLPPKFIAPVEAWIERRIDIGTRFAKLYRVLEDLDDILSTPGQVAYYFNGVVGLLDQVEDTKQLADKLREIKVPSSFPSGLSRELKDAAVEATKTVAWSLLFPDDSSKIPVRDVKFTFGNTFGYVVELPWVSRSRESQYIF